MKMRRSYSSAEILDKAREKGWNIPRVLEYVNIITDVDLQVLYLLPPERDHKGEVRRRIRVRYLCCPEPREATVRVDTLYRRLHTRTRYCVKCCQTKAVRRKERYLPDREDVRTRKFKSSVSDGENFDCQEVAWALDHMPAYKQPLEDWYPK